jgi:hypothetical protein
MTIRENRIIGGDRAVAVHTPLSDRERALRRLRDPSHAIEVLSDRGAGALDVSNFVINMDEPGITREYHCARCAAHVIVYRIQTEGNVRCPCGPLAGKPI